MLDGSESESIKEDGMIRLERNDAKIDGCVTLDQRIWFLMLSLEKTAIK